MNFVVNAVGDTYLYGPFTTRDDAEAFGEKLGTAYTITELHDPDEW